MPYSEMNGGSDVTERVKKIIIALRNIEFAQMDSTTPEQREFVIEVDKVSFVYLTSVHAVLVKYLAALPIHVDF